MLQVFYTPQMVADSRSFSPSAAKPRAVVDSWQALGVPLTLVAPAPATVEQLGLAHDAGFVGDILAGRRANGFGNRSPEVAASLPCTTGSLLAAARAALEHGVAVSPSSGFHHAGFARAGGFCTFNGLVVAARVLKQEGLIRRVGVLDCDAHYGDGTDDIVRRLGLDWIEHVSAGADFYEPNQAADFLEQLPGFVNAMGNCDLILYQAGADPHVDDPLGGWLTTEELAARDRIVFETARTLGVPVAWNLAGGYQTPLRKVLDIHDQTLAVCCDVFGA